MGQTTIKKKLEECISADNAIKTKDILLKNRVLLNQYINKSEDMTPLMLCAKYNSSKCLDVLIELLANTKIRHSKKGDGIIHIASERDNVKILNNIIGKGIEDKNLLNAYEMNCLDSAIINRCYLSACYLVHQQQMTLRPFEEYANMMNLLGIKEFRLGLFIECVKDNIPLENTPSFLYKVNELVDVKEMKNVVFEDSNTTLTNYKNNEVKSKNSEVKEYNYDLNGQSIKQNTFISINKSNTINYKDSELNKMKNLDNNEVLILDTEHHERRESIDST